MQPAFAPSRSMSSRQQLVLWAVRQHFLGCGLSPSYAEISGATGLKPQHVGRVLEKLQAAGLLTFTRGKARSIMLTDRAACLSSAELELACIARGWTITKPPAVSAPIVRAFRVDPDVTELGLPLIDALKHIG